MMMKTCASCSEPEDAPHKEGCQLFRSVELKSSSPIVAYGRLKIGGHDISRCVSAYQIDGRDIGGLVTLRLWIYPHNLDIETRAVVEAHLIEPPKVEDPLTDRL